MRPLPPLVVSALACWLPATAAAQNVQVFVGMELLVRAGSQPGVGLGLLGQGALLAVSPGPMVGPFVDARFLTTGSEFAAGGRVGGAVGAFVDCAGFVPMGGSFEVGVRHKIQGESRLRLGGDVQGMFFEGSFTTSLALEDDGSARLSEPTVGVGLDVPLVPACVAGRPLWLDGGAWLPTVLVQGPIDDPAARRWLAEGREEFASIGAFLRLAAELRTLSAPERLVRAALEAARDEERHARRCFARARQLVGGRIAVLGRSVPGPRDLPRQWLRRAVGLEAWRDGAVGEAVAAARLRADAASAPDGLDGEIRSAIARDEERHAELGFDLARWAAAFP